MDIASPLLELVKGLWGLASKPLGYICNLKDNVDALGKATGDLEAMSGDVKGTVEREEREGGVRRTNQVEKWLCKVQEFEGGVDRVLEEARECDRIKCFSRCLPQNCWLSYKLGKRVDRLLNEARELQGKKGEFSNFTSPLSSPAILAIPMVKTMGLDISFNEVWKWLADEKKTGMFGLYGMGGVGKTTLMKQINNELLCTNLKFDVVIWVVVSKQVNEDNIRDVVRKGLNIKDEIWDRWSQNHRVHNLLNILAEKKFVLLIDDVWARLELSEIGVFPPSLKNGSKVVFTTRWKQVCHQMGANETCKVSCLKPEEALTLFEKNIGKSLENCDDDIQRLAKDIAKECKGLPLALTTVGRAMAGREHPHEWHYALTTLRNKPHQLSGMEEVYHILEFSFNSLGDSIVKLCFLYCCLFPEDYLINSHDLIELWIGEGLLGDTDDVYNMRERGEYILGSLKMACLLESETVTILGRQFVKIKMHDVIRDMATWIARDHGKRENKLLVIENEKDMSTKGMSKWGEAEKVSLWGKWISNINQAPLGCSQLRTLIVRETKVSVLPGGFFDSMTACLAVLDLSNNYYIDSFPEGICNLINLRYLNLSNTRISAVPKKIRKLTHLGWLLLDYLSGGIVIPRGAITSLPLNVFSNWSSGLENEEELVEELGRMQGLTDLSIKVCESSSTLKIFRSFQRCISRVRIENCEGLTHIPISHSLKGSGNFSHLEVLCLVNCPMLVKMEITQGIGQVLNYYCFPSLVEVFLFNCGFLDLSWLVHAPKLQDLIIRDCKSTEKIIGDGIAGEELTASRLFSRLKFLTLEGLPKLRSICDRALLFPQGVTFTIIECPGLPLDSNGMRGSFSIVGNKGWWEEFEWDPAARVTLELDDEGPVEEMTYGEAARKIKDASAFYLYKIGFLPREPRSLSIPFQSLQRCIRRVRILECKDLTCIPISHSLKGRVNFLHLEVLHLLGCYMLVKMEITRGTGRVPNYSCFPSLVEVVVEGCGFSDLSWLVHVPKLQKLTVGWCDSIEKIIGDEIAGEELAASGLFSHLKFLQIIHLPKLTSICDHTLFFAQGVYIEISVCPSLKKLPWDSSNARGSFSVQGDEEWWAEFEWDPTARVTFRCRDEGSVEEEMTFGEAVRKINDSFFLVSHDWIPTQWAE